MVWLERLGPNMQDCKLALNSKYSFIPRLEGGIENIKELKLGRYQEFAN